MLTGSLFKVAIFAPIKRKRWKKYLQKIWNILVQFHFDLFKRNIKTIVNNKSDHSRVSSDFGSRWLNFVSLVTINLSKHKFFSQKVSSLRQGQWIYLCVSTFHHNDEKSLSIPVWLSIALPACLSSIIFVCLSLKYNNRLHVYTYWTIQKHDVQSHLTKMFCKLWTINFKSKKWGNSCKNHHWWKTF